MALEAAYMQRGAFTSLEDAARHHLDARASLLSYDPRLRGVAPDLANPIGTLLDLPGRIWQRRLVRSSAWIWLFSSAHSTSARSSGIEIGTDDIAHLLDHLRIVDSLNVSVRCGCRPKALQILWTL